MECCFIPLSGPLSDALLRCRTLTLSEVQRREGAVSEKKPKFSPTSHVIRFGRIRIIHLIVSFLTFHDPIFLGCLPSSFSLFSFSPHALFPFLLSSLFFPFVPLLLFYLVALPSPFHSQLFTTSSPPFPPLGPLIAIFVNISLNSRRTLQSLFALFAPLLLFFLLSRSPVSLLCSVPLVFHYFYKGLLPSCLSPPKCPPPLLSFSPPSSLPVRRFNPLFFLPR